MTDEHRISDMLFFLCNDFNIRTSSNRLSLTGQATTLLKVIRMKMLNVTWTPISYCLFRIYASRFVHMLGKQFDC